MPASAVIPALSVYDNVAAVKTFVAHIGSALVGVKSSPYRGTSVLTGYQGDCLGSGHICGLCGFL